MAKLTLNDRYNIIKYVNRLPSSIKLRSAVDGFFNLLEITPEEKEKYNISINPNTYVLSCNDQDYTVEYTDIPAPIIDSINEYISGFEGKEEYKDNEFFKNVLYFFKKIV